MMAPTKNDGKRKNTILSYYTKTPKLQVDNLSEKDKLVSGFICLKLKMILFCSIFMK